MSVADKLLQMMDSKELSWLKINGRTKDGIFYATIFENNNSIATIKKQDEDLNIITLVAKVLTGSDQFIKMTINGGFDTNGLMALEVAKLFVRIDILKPEMVKSKSLSRLLWQHKFEMFMEVSGNSLTYFIYSKGDNDPGEYHVELTESSDGEKQTDIKTIEKMANKNFDSENTMVVYDDKASDIIDYLREKYHPKRSN